MQTYKDLYLLADTSDDQATATPSTRLAHDTLAPLVRKRFDESDTPGQRARRILENRAVDWRRDANGVNGTAQSGTPLDTADLAVVEAGAAGMRVWTEKEKAGGGQPGSTAPTGTCTACCDRPADRRCASNLTGRRYRCCTTVDTVAKTTWGNCHRLSNQLARTI